MEPINEIYMKPQYIYIIISSLLISFFR